MGINDVEPTPDIATLANNQNVTRLTPKTFARINSIGSDVGVAGSLDYRFEVRRILQHFAKRLPTPTCHFCVYGYRNFGDDALHFGGLRMLCL
jgi:hypothetical protein